MTVNQQKLETYIKTLNLNTRDAENKAIAKKLMLHFTTVRSWRVDESDKQYRVLHDRHLVNLGVKL